MSEEGSGSRPRLLVDGMNVFGSRPTGWWRDRDGAVRDLTERLGALARGGEDVTVVFDGTPPAGLAEGEHGGVVVFYAGRGGPDAADDRIVELVEADSDRGSLVVVTSDRRLRERVEALGVAVQGANSLHDRLD